MAQTGTLVLKATEVHTIPLELISEADGSIQPNPAGNTFFAISDDPAVSATIDGTPALVVNAVSLPNAATPIATVTVTDSAGNAAYTLMVDYPVPVVSDIGLNLAGDVITEQPAPGA